MKSELREVIQQAGQVASHIRKPSDLWNLEDYLTNPVKSSIGVTSVTPAPSRNSVKLRHCNILIYRMDVSTPKSTRRSTRLRVEIPMTVTSMDRRLPFSAPCMALVVSVQGCGFRSPQALPLETPVLLSDLPAGATISGRVASCLPLGSPGKSFMVGVELYNPGNIWAIADPPEDWNCKSSDLLNFSVPENRPVKKATESWPYNLPSARPTGRAKK